MSRVIVTGPLGCIGSATIRRLVDCGVDEIVGVSRNTDAGWADQPMPRHAKLVSADIRDRKRIEQVFQQFHPTQVIHLAAFQTPDCEARPFDGMEVNVHGTANVFRAAARLGGGLQRFVFASSAAVYGPRAIYPDGGIEASAACLPRNLYGYWKLAGEGMAQAFHRETGCATVSVRLATTYGPGRDRGLTAAPTTALKAAALGRRFRIPYQGREHYHFVDDVGAGFAQCALEPFEGYDVINLRGMSVEGREFCQIAVEVAHALRLPDPADIAVAYDATPLPFPCDLDETAALRLFPSMPRTDLRQGIRTSLSYFARLAARGKLSFG